MPADAPIPARPLLALVVLSLVWGYTWVLSKYALAYSGPFTFAAARTLIGALCLLAVLRLRGRRLRPERLRELVPLGLVQTTAFTGLIMWALVEGAAGRTAFLVFTMPFWTLVMARLWLGERIRGSQWLAVTLAAAGLCAILDPWHLSGAIASKLLAVAAGAAWATSSVMVKRLQRRRPMELIAMTGWQMLIGTLPLLLVAQLAGEAAILWAPRFIFILLFIGLISTALCWLLWVYVLEHLPAGIASMSTLAIPLVAITLSALDLGERPHAAEALGMGLIAAALVTLSLRVRRSSRVRAPR